ncbi:MAG: CoA-binding protein [Bacteroidales bacterium]
MEKKTTLVIGASTKPERFSFKAIRLLRKYNIPVVAIGLREGDVEDVKILKGKPELKDIHTVTMYIGPQNQPDYYEYILNLNPERIIFNPGTENELFKKMINSKGVKTIENCTLVMLNSGTY